MYYDSEVDTIARGAFSNIPYQQEKYLNKYLILKVDGDNKYFELNEDNNIFYKKIVTASNTINYTESDPIIETLKDSSSKFIRIQIVNNTNNDLIDSRIRYSMSHWVSNNITSDITIIDTIVPLISQNQSIFLEFEISKIKYLSSNSYFSNMFINDKYVGNSSNNGVFNTTNGSYLKVEQSTVQKKSDSIYFKITNYGNNVYNNQIAIDCFYKYSCGRGNWCDLEIAKLNPINIDSLLPNETRLIGTKYSILYASVPFGPAADIFYKYNCTISGKGIPNTTFYFDRDFYQELPYDFKTEMNIISCMDTDINSSSIFLIYGRGLWISDGTVVGTKKLSDGEIFYYFKNTSGKLFAIKRDIFTTASDLISITETGVGTVTTLHPIGLNSPNALAIGNTLFYNNKTAAFGEELWKIDLTNFNNPNNICTSKSVEPWEMWISNVKLGSINNASGKFKDYSLLGNSDYTNISTTLTKGLSYNLNVTPSLSWVGYTPNVYARVWIDFNGNNIFEDNEKVLEQTNSLNLNANFTVLSTATNGSCKMRVAVKWGAYPTACEIFQRGEVEDYTINIIGVDPCAGDVTPPTFNSICPANYSVQVPYPNTNVDIQWKYLGVKDNCGAATEVVTPTNPLSQSVNIQLGKSVTLTHTATDTKGNTAKCTYTITATPSPCEVSDVTPPNVVCPPNLIVIALPGQTTAITNFAPATAYDNCNVITSTIATLPNGNVIIPTTPLPIGVNTIKWTATDYKGNKGTCTFNVTVQSAVNNKEDLEVTIAADKSNPTIYSNVSFKVTVKNNGTIASGKFRINMNTCTSGVIKTFIQNPGMLVYAGKPTAANIGIYDEVNQTWTINSLAAGAIATYTINAFTLSSKEITMTAFVDQQSNSDYDSSPSTTLANCLPLQDDESAVVINKGSTRESINNLDINDKVLLYPNPAGEVLNINLQNWEKQALEISIFNALGVQMIQESLDENHTPLHSIEIEKLHDGNYFIFIQSKNTRSKAQKFVK